MPQNTPNKFATSLLFFCLGVTLAHADTWDGLFIGINAGTATSTSKYQTGPNNESWFKLQNVTESMWKSGNNTRTNDATISAISIAYNRQASALVYGGEIGLSLMDVSMNKNGSYPYIPSNNHYYNYNQSSKLSGLLIIKGRTGYALGNSLLSVTAGGAATNLRTGLDFEDSYAGDGKYSASHHDRDVRFGWTAGVSYQYMLPSNFVLKAEYQYFDFGKSSFNTPVHAGDGTYITQMNYSSKISLNTFMIGVERKF